MNRTTAPSPPDARKTGLFINRSYALLWSGQSISSLGDMVFDTTLVLWIATRIVHGQSWAPLAVSAVLVVTMIPTMLVGPIAGVFVDRWNKRRTMLWMDALRAVLIVSLLPLTGLPPFDRLKLPTGELLGVIYAVVMLATCCAQYFTPARTALIGDVVDEEHRPRASGLAQVTMSLSIIVGPGLAALLVFGVGLQWALLLNATSFLISFLAVLAVRAPRSAMSVPAGAQARFLGELTAGLHFFRSNKVLMTLLITVVIAMLGAGALNALDIFFVQQNLHTSTRLYGLLGTAYGVGALAGAILAGLFAQRVGLARTFWMSVVAIGIGLLVYARLTSFAPAVILLTLVGMPQAAINVAAGPLLLQVTPRDLVGRVSSVLNPAISLASILSIAIAGYVDSTVLRGFHATVLGITLGPVDTIFTASAVLVLAGGLYAMVNLRVITPGNGTAASQAVAEAPA